jgi:hypothetical protein
MGRGYNRHGTVQEVNNRSIAHYGPSGCTASPFLNVNIRRRLNQNETDGAGGTYTQEEIEYRVWAGKRDGKRPFGRPGRRQEIILK